MALRTARPFVSRARHVIVFIAIVWGVAATFIATEVASLSAVDLALSYPALFGDLMLSRTVAESTSCVVAAGSERPPVSTAINEADARVGPWLLGLSLGRDAVFRQYAPSNRQVPEQLAKGRDDLAARLSVPSPDPFMPDRLVNANIEFLAFIENGEAAETARRLAATHSPRACELFKLGAAWGYSEMVRPLLPGEPAVFAMEIRHYASRTGVPEALWSPMLQVTAADAKREDIIASTEVMTDRLTQYLAGAPRSSGR
jgi:hypothetical protein